MRLLDERFWSKVTKQENGCWMWTASKVRGYGVFSLLGKNHLAHRLAYADQLDTLPATLPLLDHICHNGSDCSGGESCPHRACVNPEHLVASTHRANLLASPLTLAAQNAAKTHCPAGHVYDEANTYLHRGLRNCRECNRERVREYQRRKRHYRTGGWDE